MSSPAAMTREAALRLGLAARALPDIKVADLVQGIARHVGLPLTEAKLGAITVSDLRAVLAGEDASEFNCEVGFPQETLKEAVRMLWGEGNVGDEASAVVGLPTLDGDNETTIAGAIRVACASNAGEWIDGHFGSCERFLVYLVSPTAVRLVALRSTLEADHAEDRNLARAALISDCQIVYLQSVGGPAAAKIIRAGVHPVKLGDPEGNPLPARPAREVLAELQVALGSPPPWLARIMGVDADSLVRLRALVTEGEET